jgi:succinyl-diaminopimelate desuccinylase
MDDKGPTMCALYALKAIAESGLPLQRRIRILFGLNEETGSADMAYYKAHGGEIPVMGFTPDGEYPIINGEKGLINEAYRCEFTQEGPLRLISMWGGTAHNIVPNYAWAEFACTGAVAASVCAMEADKIRCTQTSDGVRIEAEGINAHGGTPWEGENAIGRLMLFLNRLPLEGALKTAVAFLAEKIGMECDGKSLGIAMEDEVSGILTMNLGVLRADETSMEVKLNYRYPVTRFFADCGPQTVEAFRQAGFERTVAGHKEKLYMPPEHPLVKKLLGVYHRCTGLEPVPKSIGGGTYAKMIPNVLAFGPIFPGDEVREHKPDEFMELSRLQDNANILAEAMYAMASDETKMV